jgi:adiponectin receptor
MAHAALIFGIRQADQQMGWGWYVREGIFYVSGALIYVVRLSLQMKSADKADLGKAKIPERWYSGRFDLWGSSHQIFHVCVLFGAACHLTGALKAFRYNHDTTTMRC